MANLVHYVVRLLDFDVSGIFLWTDSSIVLSWLAKPPCTWDTFVANRTSRILELVPDANWRYVSTHENPADLGTRGCKPQDLVNNTLWWQGPSWITNPCSSWPKINLLFSAKEEKQVQALQVSVEQADILSRFSSYA